MRRGFGRKTVVVDELSGTGRHGFRVDRRAGGDWRGDLRGMLRWKCWVALGVRRARGNMAVRLEKVLYSDGEGLETRSMVRAMRRALGGILPACEFPGWSVLFTSGVLMSGLSNDRKLGSPVEEIERAHSVWRWYFWIWGVWWE